MLSRINNLFRVIQSLGGAGAVLKLGPTLFAVLGKLRDAETFADYLDLAVEIVTPLAPMTDTDWDDGLLIALIALKNDPEFIEWGQAKISAVDPLTPLDDDGEGIPDGALAYSYQIQTTDDLPETVPATAQAFSVGQAIPLIVKYLPAILELIRQLRDTRHEIVMADAA